MSNAIFEILPFFSGTENPSLVGRLHFFSSHLCIFGLQTSFSLQSELSKSSSEFGTQPGSHFGEDPTQFGFFHSKLQLFAVPELQQWSSTFFLISPLDWVGKNNWLDTFLLMKPSPYRFCYEPCRTWQNSMATKHVIIWDYILWPHFGWALHVIALRICWARSTNHCWIHITILIGYTAWYEQKKIVSVLRIWPKQLQTLPGIQLFNVS